MKSLSLGSIVRAGMLAVGLSAVAAACSKDDPCASSGATGPSGACNQPAPNAANCGGCNPIAHYLLRFDSSRTSIPGTAVDGVPMIWYFTSVPNIVSSNNTAAYFVKVIGTYRNPATGQIIKRDSVVGIDADKQYSLTVMPVNTVPGTEAVHEGVLEMYGLNVKSDEFRKLIRVSGPAVQVPPSITSATITPTLPATQGDNVCETVQTQNANYVAVDTAGKATPAFSNTGPNLTACFTAGAGNFTLRAYAGQTGQPTATLDNSITVTPLTAAGQLDKSTMTAAESAAFTVTGTAGADSVNYLIDGQRVVNPVAGNTAIFNLNNLTVGNHTLTPTAYNGAVAVQGTARQLTVNNPLALVHIRAVDLYSGVTDATRTLATGSHFVITKNGTVLADTTVASGDLSLNMPIGSGYTVDVTRGDMIPGYASLVNANGIFAGLNRTNALASLSNNASGMDLLAHLYLNTVPDVGVGYGTDGLAAIKFWLNNPNYGRGGVTNRFGANYTFWKDTTGFSTADLGRIPELEQTLQACEGAAVVNRVTVTPVLMNRLPTAADGNNIFYINKDPNNPGTANVFPWAGWGQPLSSQNPTLGLFQLTFKNAIGVSVIADALEANIPGVGGQNSLMTPTVPTNLSVTGNYMCGAVGSVPSGTSF